MILLLNQKPVRRFGLAFRQRDAKCGPGYEAGAGVVTSVLQAERTRGLNSSGSGARTVSPITMPLLR